MGIALSTLGRGCLASHHLRIFQKPWLSTCYMLSDIGIYQSRMLATRFESLSLLSLQNTLADMCDPPTGEIGVYTAAFIHSTNTDNVLRYETFLMFGDVCMAISNYNLYSKGKEWSEMWKYVLWRSQHPQVLQYLPDSVAATFKAGHSSTPRPGVIWLDEDGMPGNQQPQQSPL